MDRYLLRYFLAIVETGNFSRAAARENVAQPTLSAGIAKLETQLGARLFDRTNRRVHLTEAGGRFLTHARRIEHEFNLAQAAVSEPRMPILSSLGETLKPFMPFSTRKAVTPRLASSGEVLA